MALDFRRGINRLAITTALLWAALVFPVTVWIAWESADASPSRADRRVWEADRADTAAWAAKVEAWKEEQRRERARGDLRSLVSRDWWTEPPRTESAFYYFRSRLGNAIVGYPKTPVYWVLSFGVPLAWWLLLNGTERAVEWIVRGFRVSD